MMDAYLKRKDQMTNSGTPKANVVDVAVEVQKRSATPNPVSSVSKAAPVSAPAASTPSNKKILYKSDLENVKTEFQQKHADLVSQHVANSSAVSDVKTQVNTLSKSVETLSKSVDLSQVDSLKNTLNDSIAKTNTSLNHVADTLVSHLDKLNSLDARVSAIENLL